MPPLGADRISVDNGSSTTLLLSTMTAQQPRGTAVVNGYLLPTSRTAADGRARRQPADVAAIITAGNVIDERHYAGRPFPTQILLGWTDHRPLHVVLAVDPAGPHYVITVYQPDIARWHDDLRSRREQQ